MSYVFIFVLGLLFGSFANVMVLRLNTGESLIFGGSRCLFCGRNLKWFELVPVLSFLFLKSRCRVCGSKVSWQYPAVELFSGILFLFLWLELGSNQTGQNSVLTILTSLVVLFFWLFLVISVYDIRHKIIPNSLVYAAIATALLSAFINSFSGFRFQVSGLWPYFISGLGLFLFFASLWFISRGRWMGFGDAKMALALGLFLGWPKAAVGLVFAFWIGAVFGVGLLVLKGVKVGKGWKGVQIPFAPFLFAGGLAAYLWGEAVISWYLSLI